MNTNLQTQIINELTIIATIMAPLFIGLRALWKSKLKDYLNAKTDSINNEDLRKFIKSSLETVDDLVTKEITNAEVTLKPAILQSIADGKVTKDELKSLSGIVKDKVLSQIPTDTQSALQSNNANFNTYLSSTIETILSKLKLDPTSVVSKTVIPESSAIAGSTSSDTTATVSVEEHQAVVDENSKLKSQLEGIQSLLGIASNTANNVVDTSNNAVVTNSVNVTDGSVGAVSQV